MPILSPGPLKPYVTLQMENFPLLSQQNSRAAWKCGREYMHTAEIYKIKALTKFVGCKWNLAWQSVSFGVYYVELIKINTRPGVFY